MGKLNGSAILLCFKLVGKLYCEWQTDEIY